MLLPALLLCFILLLLVAVYYRPPKSWDEIEAEDRKKAAKKGMEYLAWLEARAKKKARSIPKATRREVFARDSYRCVQCGAAEELTIDHIFPFALGGSNAPENLQVCVKPVISKKEIVLRKPNNKT